MLDDLAERITGDREGRRVLRDGGALRVRGAQGRGAVVNGTDVGVGPGEHGGPTNDGPYRRGEVRDFDAVRLMEPDLVIWVDDGGEGVVDLTLAGVLDERTGPSVLQAVEELLREGHRDIRVDAGALEAPDGLDLCLVLDVELACSRAGGRIGWAGLPRSDGAPCPT